MGRWWVSDLFEASPVLLVSHVVWVIGSICLHELAHGWAAIRRGDRTPIETGHMTWNPLVHMGKFSLLMFALVGIAWGVMPVNPSRMRGRHADMEVALAGPAMNVALAVIAVVLGGLWAAYGVRTGEPLYPNVAMFFFTGAYLNLVLAGFNLLPVPPLDGSRVAMHLFPAYRRLSAHPNFPIIGLALLVIVFFQAGNLLFEPAMDLSAWGIQALARALPG